MTGWLNELLGRLAGAPEPLVYLVLALAAGLENVIPPIPADVIVLFGGLLAGRGMAEPALVFPAVWIGNVAGALLVYGIGRRHGFGFFQGRWGRLLLKPGQLERLSAVYRRYGFGVIFVSRFLPMFRAVVPVFAGVARLGFLRTAIPMALASAAWYGMLVYLGAAAGRNWGAIARRVESAGQWLWLAAGVAAVGAAWWWWKTRREE